MSDPRSKINRRIYADIRKRVDTYYKEMGANDASFSKSFKIASETLHAFAPNDMRFLCDEVERLSRLLEKNLKKTDSSENT